MSSMSPEELRLTAKAVGEASRERAKTIRGLAREKRKWGYSSGASWVWS